MTDMGWREASELHRREDNAACLYEVLVKFLNFSDLLFLYLLLLFTPFIVFDSFETPWKEDHQAPLSVGFPRQEYWRGLPFPPPGDLPDTGIEPMSPSSAAWQVDSFPLSHLGSAKIVVTNIS